MRVYLAFAALALSLVTGCGSDEPSAPGPSSEELIETAVAAGTLTAEQGILYRVYAAFGDPRLPAGYRGERLFDGTSAIEDALTGLPGFSAETQAILRPFLLPPSAPGSWLAQGAGAAPQSATVRGLGVSRSAIEIEWTKVKAAGGKVTVWSQNRYAGEDGLAQRFATELDRVIWKKLFMELGMREPMSDAGQENNGGDGSLDVYIVHTGAESAYGTATPYGEGDCVTGPVPTYLTVNAQAGSLEYLVATVAHELMHASQNMYALSGGCNTYRWWKEASATWVEDFVYPTVDSEQIYTNAYMRYPLFPLEHTGAQHQYGAYLFPFFVHRHFGKASFVERSWAFSESATHLEALAQALTAATGKTFKDVWPEFVLRNYNTQPVVDYERWDGIPFSTQEDERVRVHMALDQQPLATNVPHLAARYITVSVAEPSVRRITLDNDMTADQVKGGHAWVIANIGGTWKEPEPLAEHRTWCRDKPDENVEQLMIIVSNSVHDDPSYTLPDGAIRLSARTVGCKGWSGNISSHQEMALPTGTGSYDWRLAVSFEPVGSGPLDENLFALTDVAYTYEALVNLSERNPPCQTKATASGAGLGTGMFGLGDSGELRILPGTPDQYFFTVSLYSSRTITEVTDCNDEHVEMTSTYPATAAAFSSNMPFGFDMDGHARGMQGFPGGATTTWDLMSPTRTSR